MKKLIITAIREEDVLPPTALLMLRGGQARACGSNKCTTNSGDCEKNTCTTFTGSCGVNNCESDKCSTHQISQPCSSNSCGGISIQAKTNL